MLEKWEALLTIFVNAINAFTQALTNVFSDITNFDIKTFDINLLIFSETPIVTITLYDLINLIVFVVVFIWFFNLIIGLIMTPINYAKRLLSPRGVTKR